MILDLFKYFSRFPRKEGVLSMFANGASAFPQYAVLLDYVNSLPDPLVPALENFVFGQTFDDVKKRVDSIAGNFLFIDFGEFSSSRDGRNSITDRQKVAATVAMKVSDTADMVEVAIVSDVTLSLLASLRHALINDAQSEALPWMDRLSDSHEIIPFISPEFHAVGWTLMFTSSAADFFGVKNT